MTDTLPEPLRLAEDAEKWANRVFELGHLSAAIHVRKICGCLRSTHAEAEKLRARVAELEAELAEAGKDAACHYKTTVATWPGQTTYNCKYCDFETRSAHLAVAHKCDAIVAKEPT